MKKMTKTESWLEKRLTLDRVWSYIQKCYNYNQPIDGVETLPEPTIIYSDDLSYPSYPTRMLTNNFKFLKKIKCWKKLVSDKRFPLKDVFICQWKAKAKDNDGNIGEVYYGWDPEKNVMKFLKLQDGETLVDESESWNRAIGCIKWLDRAAVLLIIAIMSVLVVFFGHLEVKYHEKLKKNAIIEKYDQLCDRENGPTYLENTK